MAIDTRRLVVPYTTRWSAEAADRVPVVARGNRRGIGYADEIVTDRDRRGVLWQRAPSLPGKGRPEFGKVHSGRQRRAMRNLLCQVCAEPADQTDLGTLWLLSDRPDFHDDWPGWPEGMATAEPPICLPCAHLSMAVCPALRKGRIAIRVARPTVGGVRGVLYGPGPLLPKPVDEVMVTYDNPLTPWICGAHLVRELFGCTVVPLAV